MNHMSFATLNGWRALSLRRLAHLDQLKRSGRWRLIYKHEATFNKALMEADADAARWKMLVQAAAEDRASVPPET
jgi:hypothetical protein